MRLHLKHRANPPVTLLDAMGDKALFARWFKDPRTWRSWRVFLKALFGLHLTFGERVTFSKYTGRTTPPRKQAKEAWIVAGRRSGKSFITALITIFLACFRDYRKHLAPGERATCMVIATDRRQSRVILRYISALLNQTPMLARMIEREGLESIDLSNSAVIEVHTASFRSTRGYTIACAILDEAAFFRSEEAANPAEEIVAALLPGMSTIPGSMLIGISSPYARNGILWQRYRDHYGHDADPVLIWQADTRSMNPTVPQETIDAAYADDPISAAAEYGATFRTDVESFLQQELIDGAVAEGVHEIVPQPGVSYVGYADPAGGAGGGDSFTLAIAHAESKQVVLDVCRGRRPPFNPAQVVKEFADLLKSYRLSEVRGDYYSAEWCTSAFAECGITYRKSERTTSDTYLECLPLFSTGAVRLLDNRELLAQLRGLERRTGRGKDVISHPPRSHDDLATSACGSLLSAVRGTPINFEEHSYVPDERDRAQIRADLSEHLVTDLGFGGDVNDDSDGPFAPGWRIT